MIISEPVYIYNFISNNFLSKINKFNQLLKLLKIIYIFNYSVFHVDNYKLDTLVQVLFDCFFMYVHFFHCISVNIVNAMIFDIQI